MNTKFHIPKVRNWVAKNNRNRSARYRVATDYQRQPKHRNQETAGWKTTE